MQPEQFISRVISDGRITIPAKVVKKHAIVEGEFLEVQIIRKIAPKTPKEA